MTTTSSADEAPKTQHVLRGLELLDPMPYVLTVNGSMVARGTFHEVRAAVAELVTRWLADDPVSMAERAQAINLAWTSGTAAQDLAERGEWFTVIDPYGPAPMRVLVRREE